MGSHLIGALLSVVATYVLVRRARRNGMGGVEAGTYGVLMTLAFSISALFHYVDVSSPRYELYNRLDHVAIFLMIAGTGTAIYAALRARWTTYLARALWGCALLGVGLKLTFWSMPVWLTAGLYLVVGWLGSVGVVVVGQSVDERPIWFFVLGGIAFSVGAVVHVVGWPVLWAGVIGPHGVFHLLVLLGAALHFDFVYRHCTHRTFPNRPASGDARHALPQAASSLSAPSTRRANPVSDGSGRSAGVAPTPAEHVELQV